MLVGWLLQRQKRMRINAVKTIGEFEFKKIQVINVIVWILTFALMLYLILGLHSQSTGELIPIFWRFGFLMAWNQKIVEFAEQCIRRFRSQLGHSFSRGSLSRATMAMEVSENLIHALSLQFTGPMNSFMSWHIWVPLGRLSFCGYLVHYPVIIF